MRIEVASEEYKTFKGNAKVSGNPYEIHKQDAVIHLNGEVRKYELQLPAKLGEQPTPHEPGIYEVDLEESGAIYFDRNGNLQVSIRSLGQRID